MPRSARVFLNHRPPEELYDVRADPWEQHNLAADPQQAATVAALRDDLIAWMREQGDEGMKTERALPEIDPGAKKAAVPGDKVRS